MRLLFLYESEVNMKEIILLKLIVAVVTVVGMAFLAAKGFMGLPSDKQQAKVKEWLIWACIEAEKKLQSGTGQLKLREVYNAFCSVPAFSVIAKFISFDLFSLWVGEALIEAKKMLTTNLDLAKYVYGEAAGKEVEKLKTQIGGG